MSLLNQSSQQKHLKLNKDSSWIDETKWDRLIEYDCPNIEPLYGSVSDLPSIHHNSNPKCNSVTQMFQSSRLKQGQYRIKYVRLVTMSIYLLKKHQRTKR
jgi:hypothetical protein